MTHPLIGRLTDDIGWPHLDSQERFSAFVERAGVRLLFVPGDPTRTHEAANIAAMLPDLRAAFDGAFDCAVIGEGAEAAVRDATGVLRTPCLVFYRDGVFCGALPRCHDWYDCVARLSHVLAHPLDAAEPASADTPVVDPGAVSRRYATARDRREPGHGAGDATAAFIPGMPPKEGLTHV